MPFQLTLRAQPPSAEARFLGADAVAVAQLQQSTGASTFKRRATVAVAVPVVPSVGRDRLQLATLLSYGYGIRGCGGSEEQQQQWRCCGCRHCEDARWLHDSVIRSYLIASLLSARTPALLYRQD